MATESFVQNSEVQANIDKYGLFLREKLPITEDNKAQEILSQLQEHTLSMIELMCNVETDFVIGGSTQERQEETLLEKLRNKIVEAIDVNIHNRMSAEDTQELVNNTRKAYLGSLVEKITNEIITIVNSIDQQDSKAYSYEVKFNDIISFLDSQISHFKEKNTAIVVNCKVSIATDIKVIFEAKKLEFVALFQQLADSKKVEQSQP